MVENRIYNYQQNVKLSYLHKLHSEGKLFYIDPLLIMTMLNAEKELEEE